ncbi:hypothetical protein J6590_063671 [Homalodisca vitripennis]|nr:hypothetical protein J6590_063671 [Homalodisca vitripennis]
MLLIVGLDNSLQQPADLLSQAYLWLISGTTVRPLPGCVAVVVLVSCNSGAMLLIVGLDNSLQQPTCCHRLISGTTVRPLPGCVAVVVLFTAADLLSQAYLWYYSTSLTWLCGGGGAIYSSRRQLILVHSTPYLACAVPVTVTVGDVLIVGLDNSLQQPTCCHRLISGTTVRPLPGYVAVVVLFTAADLLSQAYLWYHSTSLTWLCGGGGASQLTVTITAADLLSQAYLWYYSASLTWLCGGGGATADLSQAYLWYYSTSLTWLCGGGGASQGERSLAHLVWRLAHALSHAHAHERTPATPNYRHTCPSR